MYGPVAVRHKDMVVSLAAVQQTYSAAETRNWDVTTEARNFRKLF